MWSRSVCGAALVERKVRGGEHHDRQLSAGRRGGVSGGPSREAHGSSIKWLIGIR